MAQQLQPEQVLGTAAPCTCSAPPCPHPLGPPLRHTMGVNGDGWGAFEQGFVSEPCLYIKIMSRGAGSGWGPLESILRVCSPQELSWEGGERPAWDLHTLKPSTPAPREKRGPQSSAQGARPASRQCPHPVSLTVTHCSKASRRPSEAADLGIYPGQSNPGHQAQSWSRCLPPVSPSPEISTGSSLKSRKTSAY